MNRGKPVKINGTLYPSVSEAARQNRVSKHFILKRLGGKSEYSGSLDPKDSRFRPREVTIGDRTFPSMSLAAKHFRCSRDWIEKLVGDEDFAEEFIKPERSGDKKRCPVTIRGETFPSMTAAARHFNLNSSTVSKYVREGKADDLPDIKALKNYPHTTGCCVDGEWYATAKEYAQKSGLSDYMTLAMINDPEYPNWRRMSYEEYLDEYETKLIAAE